MNTLRNRCLVLAVAATVISLSAPHAVGQKFLKYGRVICRGAVAVKTLETAQLPVQQYQNVIARVPGNLIEWFCERQRQPAFECPKGTNVVQVDHRQPGPVLTITCLQR